MLLYEPSPVLLSAEIQSKFLSVQRESLAYLASVECPRTLLKALSSELLDMAHKEDEAGECRIAAIELLGSLSLLPTIEGDKGMHEMMWFLLERYQSSVIVPLKEALLPLIARLVALVRCTLSSGCSNVIDGSSSIGEGSSSTIRDSPNY